MEEELYEHVLDEGRDVAALGKGDAEGSRDKEERESSKKDHDSNHSATEQKTRMPDGEGTGGQ